MYQFFRGSLKRCRDAAYLDKNGAIDATKNEAAKRQHMLFTTSRTNILLSICSLKQLCRCVQTLSDGSLQSEASVPLYAKSRFPLATASDAPSMFQRKGH